MNPDQPKPSLAIDAYLEAVARLWPSDRPVTLQQRSTKPSGAESLLVVPDPRHVRMVVPADNRRAAAGALLRFSSAIGVRERARRIGVAGALTAGGDRLLKYRLDIATRDGSLVEELSEAVSVRVDASLTLGTPRANRKPVLQLFDPRGSTVGFTKVGYSTAVHEVVRAEARALEELAGAGLPSVLEVPRVLDLRTWQGMPTLTMSTLRVRALARRLPETAVPVEQMDALAAAFDEGTQALHETGLWRRLSSAAGAGQLDRMAALRDQALEVDGDVDVRVGAWHGDWTAWNMSWRSGRLQLWDWERFERGVPFGLDHCHYTVNAAFLSEGPNERAVRSGLDRALSASSPGTVAHAVGTSYLLAILDRYLGAEPSRGKVAERVEALLGALERWLS